MSVAEKLKLDSERGRRRQDPAEVAQQAAQVSGACPCAERLFASTARLSIWADPKRMLTSSAFLRAFHCGH
jgi:hypothetical protein